MAIRMSPRTTTVSLELVRLERQLEKHLADLRQSYVWIGATLRQIAVTRAYREDGYATFESYLQGRWPGLGRRTAYHMMEASESTRDVQALAQIEFQIPFNKGLLLARMSLEDRLAAVQQPDFTSWTTRELSAWERAIRAERLGRRDGETPAAIAVPAAPAVLPDAVDVRQADAAALPWDDGSVDLWVTSPPYCLGLQVDGYIDYTDYGDYLERAARWAAELYRATAPWGRLAINVALDISHPRQFLCADWARVLASAGWIYRTGIVWKEGNISRGTARGSIDSADSPNVVCPAELVLVWRKGDWNLAPIRQRRREWRRSDLTRQDWLEWTIGSWSFAGEKAKRVGGHPSAFPEELPRRLITLYSFPGAVVGDPFVGSGTTALVGAQLGRRVLGSDLSRACVALSRARVATTLQTREEVSA